MQHHTAESARLQARLGYEKDVLYLRWNTTRGPVYVTETPDTPPNPYLAKEPERDITTPSGRRLTMVNAYMTRQVHEMTEKEYGVRGHITSLNPIRPENAADPWETEALKAIERGRGEVSSIEKMDGQDYMRLLGPLVTEQGCLKCHADQGYQVGDIRGGLSISIPMGPSAAIARRYVALIIIIHGGIWLTGVTGIVLGGRKLRASRDAIRLRDVQLAQHGQQLQDTNDALDRELKSVGDVQVSLLPARVPEIPGFDVAAYSRPARLAGGDYYDFFRLPDNQWGILVADVSGHGAPATVVMAMTYVVLHMTERKSPAGHVLGYLNKVLSEDISTNQFVTCSYGILDPQARTLTFASAGHPVPLLLDPSTGRAHECAIDAGPPLGVDAAVQYSTSSITLEPGSILLLYTDGVTEARGFKGRKFGLAGLTSVFEAHGAEEAVRVRDAVLAALDEHVGTVELNDDTTLVVLRAGEMG